MKTPKRALQEKQLHLICSQSLRALTLAYAMSHLSLGLSPSSPCLPSPPSSPTPLPSPTKPHNASSSSTYLNLTTQPRLSTLALPHPIDFNCFPTTTLPTLPLLNPPEPPHPHSGTEFHLGTPRHCRHGLHRSPPPILQFPGPQPLFHTQTLAPCPLHSP